MNLGHCVQGHNNYSNFSKYYSTTRSIDQNIERVIWLWSDISRIKFIQIINVDYFSNKMSILV